MDIWIFTHTHSAKAQNCSPRVGTAPALDGSGSVTLSLKHNFTQMRIPIHSAVPGFQPLIVTESSGFVKINRGSDELKYNRFVSCHTGCHKFTELALSGITQSMSIPPSTEESVLVAKANLINTFFLSHREVLLNSHPDPFQNNEDSCAYMSSLLKFGVKRAFNSIYFFNGIGKAIQIPLEPRAYPATSLWDERTFISWNTIFPFSESIARLSNKGE